MEQLFLSLGGVATGLAVAWYWIKALREDMKTMRSDRISEMASMKAEHSEEIKCLADAHNAEVARIQERMDRMNERQDVLFRRALAKTDLKDSGRGLSSD